MLRTETRPKIRVIESLIIFRIYFAEVSGWGREFVNVVCKCCKDEIKICVISLLCVKINLLTKTFIIPLNERYVSTKEWVPAAEDCLIHKICLVCLVVSMLRNLGYLVLLDFFP